VPLTGQEAAQIGSGRASQPQDYIFPTYREHGVALTRNVDLAELLRQFRGVSNGGWNPKDTNFHLYTLVLAAQTLHAVGYAMGIQRDQKLAAASDPVGTEPPAAVMAYYGDGASSEGDVHESMVFASSFNAPVVFFCQNNHWAISVPLERQTVAPIWKKAGAHGFPGIPVDGNDVLAVYQVTREAAARAREEGTPTLIEAVTYRLGPHSTADDAARYQPAEEIERWKGADPLERYRRFLDGRGLLDDAFVGACEQEAKDAMARLREGVLASGPRPVEELFSWVFEGDLPQHLKRQRDEVVGGGEPSRG
jgi:2-oxoisovalerate dehydrogenase E1 component alpha subunit